MKGRSCWAQWGEDGSLVDVRIGIGHGPDAGVTVNGDPLQHKQMRVQPFDGLEMAPQRQSAGTEHAEAEPQTPLVRLQHTACLCNHLRLPHLWLPEGGSVLATVPHSAVCVCAGLNTRCCVKARSAMGKQALQHAGS